MATSSNGLVTTAYEEVRRQVLSGRLPPGSRVTVRPLTDLLGLSPTPVRTALAALESEGFLEVREHRGYFVPVIGAEDMREIYEIREAVDGIASRRAARRPDRESLVAELTDLLARQRDAVEQGDLLRYGELDVAFHHEIWRSAGNLRLARVAGNLLAQQRIGTSISARAPGRLPLALEEHASIVAAVQRGDAGAAERLTRRHVRRAGVATQRLLGGAEGAAATPEG